MWAGELPNWGGKRVVVGNPRESGLPSARKENKGKISTEVLLENLGKQRPECDLSAEGRKSMQNEKEYLRDMNGESKGKPLCIIGQGLWASFPFCYFVSPVSVLRC